MDWPRESLRSPGQAAVQERARCWNVESARLGRQHNDANVLSLGERMISLEMALEVVRVWLETGFEGGRHQRRIEMIDEPMSSQV